MSQVRTITPQIGLSRAEEQGIFDLVSQVWPSAAGEEPRDLEQMFADLRADAATYFLIGDTQIWAHALMFAREIITPTGPLVVGALAGVCTHPDTRNRGWGAAVARAAFAHLPAMDAPVALFQTGVPQFYEKLGARLVTNRFFNGENSENPFWDPWVMIYPASFAWPEGPIDLNGEGY